MWYLKRFPEELSGVGCFGSSIFRTLPGAGYSLYWAQNVVGVVNTQPSSVSSSFNSSRIQCGCVAGDVGMRGDMMVLVNRFDYLL